jgi:hypothetical protein
MKKSSEKYIKNIDKLANIKIFIAFFRGKKEKNDKIIFFWKRKQGVNLQGWAKISGMMMLICAALINCVGQ